MSSDKACKWGGCNGDVPSGGGKCNICGDITEVYTLTPEEERLVAMYTDKTYTLSGLSREFIKEIQILANARGMHRDYNIVTEVALPIHAEDRANENAFRDSFKAGDLVKITIKGDPRNSTQTLAITSITLDRYAVGKSMTRVWFSDSSWCWLYKVSPDWINKV